MLSLNEEQQLIVRMLRDIAVDEFQENACAWQGEYPWTNIELLADQGFVGLNLPEAYGGGGLGEFEAILALETVGSVCPDTGYTLYTNSMVAPRAIDMFGTDAAKEYYLPPVCNGKSTIAIAISEPEAGSDAGAMTTRIDDQNGELVLNGEKIWVSAVPEADAAVVWTRFPDDNLGTVIMDFDAAGVEIGTHFTNMAGHTQTHFFMEDVHIPKENVLVRGRDAMKEQLKALNWERIGAAAFSNAIARCAVLQALDYASEREQFDQSISGFQGLRWKIADMVKNLETSRSMTYRAALTGEAQDRVPDRLETSIAKLYGAEIVEAVVSDALQVFGATGYQQEHPLEYLYRLQRGRRIAAGTDEIMKNNIADVVFEDGLPALA